MSDRSSVLDLINASRLSAWFEDVAMTMAVNSLGETSGVEIKLPIPPMPKPLELCDLPDVWRFAVASADMPAILLNAGEPPK